MSDAYIWCFLVLQTAIYGDRRVQEVLYYHTVQVNCTRTAPQYEARKGNPQRMKTLVLLKDQEGSAAPGSGGRVIIFHRLDWVGDNLVEASRWANVHKIPVWQNLVY